MDDVSDDEVSESVDSEAGGGAEQAGPSEAERTAEFMARRAAPDDDSDDSEEVAAALAQAQLDRRVRQAEEAGSVREVSALVRQAEEATAAGQHMDAVARYTDALAIAPRRVELLEARGSLCARLNLHKATLHDGELIVSMVPDWHHGHRLCGMALFCLRQYAPAVRAYRRALEYAPSSDVRGSDGLKAALADAQAKLDEELRMAVLKEDRTELTRLLFGGGGLGRDAAAAGAGGGAGGGATAFSAVDLEAREPSQGFTVLALAAAAGKTESAKMLLKAGAAVDPRDKFGKTPLIWACALGHEKLALALCSAGADQQARDAVGWDALYAACHGGHVRLVVLLAQKADLGRALADGTTCLMAAAQGGRPAVIKMLLTKGAEAHVANKKGRRALELAREGKTPGHRECVDLLAAVTSGPPPTPPPSPPPPPRRASAGGSGSRTAARTAVPAVASALVLALLMALAYHAI
jgi:tetratricopeptide (TPR) repeat protein